MKNNNQQATVRMNISATLNVFRLITSPSLCLPHLQVPTFNDLAFPLEGIPKFGGKIKAIVLDKDNCFAQKYDDKVWHEYKKRWETLKATYPKENILIVSNSAGTNDDIGHQEAARLEKNTGVAVFRHSTKKPGCYPEILKHFQDKNIIESPNELAIVGDRLFTDMLMANMMGSYGVWTSQGVQESQSLICKIERSVYRNLITRGFYPPSPK